MELEELIGRLSGMSSGDIRQVAGTLNANLDSTAAEVAWWQATMAIDGALRRYGRGRTAAQAGHEASRAVLDAAGRAGMRLPDTEVTCAARAARDLARGLVAGESAGAALSHLLDGWSSLLGDPGAPAAVAGRPAEGRAVISAP